MWRQIYDEHGSKVDSNSGFFRTLSGDHQTTAKVELLDTDLRKVKDSTIFSADRTNVLTNFITDGNIDVDTTRGARRTAELTLMNPTAEFTPGTDRYQGGAGQFTGKIYLNRVVRIWKGLYVVRRPLYVPVGTFMIDVATVIMERNMSLVNLTMTDLWKKIAKSFASHDITYAEGAHYNSVIRDMVDYAGIDLDTAVIDGLGDRPSDESHLQNKFVLKEGESRGDVLKTLAQRWDIDMYFDPMGRFRTEDRRSAEDKSVVWRYSTPPIEEGHGGNLITLQRSFNDDNLYNHVVVTWTGKDKDKTQHRIQRINTNPSSPLSVDRIGDRVLYKTYENIHTQSQAERALDRLWKLKTQLSESIEAQVMANPALEGDDVVRVSEGDFVKVNSNYRLTRFNVPLISSLQTIQATKTLDEDNF